MGTKCKVDPKNPFHPQIFTIVSLLCQPFFLVQLTRIRTG